MPNSSELGELIELLQRTTERTSAALDARMHEWRTQQTSDYQRVLDSLYRLERKVGEVEKGQKDMQVAQGAYQDTEHEERHARQEENDRRFRRIERRLAAVIVALIALLVVLVRILWLWWGGV